MRALYNEIDDFACGWISNLMDAGLITPGKIDNRPIQELTADDTAGFDRVHFFAGIGGWDYALTFAGWGERPIWTGSCPCQPFSTAGRRGRQSDERHLWPHWYRLIRESKPECVLGEQVASAIAAGWWDDVATDLEAEGYACAATVLPACSVGAPHRRDRLWFVADSNSGRLHEDASKGQSGGEYHAESRSPLGNAEHDGRHGGQVSGSHAGNVWQQAGEEGKNSAQQPSGAGEPKHVANSQRLGQSGQGQLAEPMRTEASRIGQADRAFNDSAGLQWLVCPDGKARPVEPSIRLLADAVPNRVGRLRGYGNAIVPTVAAEFIRAYMETQRET